MNRESVGTTLRRRDEILRLVRHHTVKSQDSLLHLLRRQGFRVAQPTLSRDLTELRLVKTPAGYVFPPVDLEGSGQARSEKAEGKLDRALKEFARSIAAAGTLVVIRTPPAEAHPLARAIDRSGIEEVVGTIAGDDTVFLAARSASAAARLKRRLELPVRPAARRRRA